MPVGTFFSDRILPRAQYGATAPAESVGPTTSILASTRAPEYKLELKPCVWHTHAQKNWNYGLRMTHFLFIRLDYLI